jgi:hypothetical protein
MDPSYMHFGKKKHVKIKVCFPLWPVLRIRDDLSRKRITKFVIPDPDPGGKKAPDPGVTKPRIPDPTGHKKRDGK